MRLLIMCLIAFRNVRRNLRRSLLTITAISFGLFCLLVFQSLKTGLHREMVNGAVDLDAGSLQIHAAGYEANHTTLQTIEDARRVVDELQRHKGMVYAPRLKFPVLILAGQKSSSVLLSGIDPTRESAVTIIHTKVVAGNYLEKKKNILLGKELAAGLDVGVGDTITLMTQNVFGRPVIKKFPVGGIYKTGLASFNRAQVYVHLEDAQSLFGVGDEWTEVAVRSDHAGVKNLAVSLARVLQNDTYQIRTWEEIAPDVKQLIDLNDATMTLLIIIVFVIVAMGITNTMTTVIYERFGEIGILTTIGTTPAGIVGMIVLESLFLGLAASIGGTVAGGLVSWHLSQHGVNLTHFISNNQYFANSHVLKAYLVPSDFIMANAVTLLTALIAGIYPAITAARTEPVKAIVSV